MPETTSIVIVDDHPIFRLGLTHALLLEGGLSVIGEGASAAEAVALVRSLKPEVLLLDASMDDNGLDRIRDIFAVHPALRIIILTVSQSDEDVAKALEAGVSGYVLKGMTGRELADIIRLVCSGQTYISPRAMGGVLAALRWKSSKKQDLAERFGLSAKELTVLRLVAQGLNNREIAMQVGVTERTIKFHLSNVFAKLDVRNRVEAGILVREFWTDGRK